MEEIINETTIKNMQKNNNKLLMHITKCENEIRKLQTENNKLKTINVFAIETIEKITEENNKIYESIKQNNIRQLSKNFFKGF